MTLEQLKELPIETLKSLAYDQMALLQQTEGNLRTLNQLIAEKSQTAEVEKAFKEPIEEPIKEEKKNDK